LDVPPEAQPSGRPRSGKVVFLRVPVEVYQKLQRLTGAQLSKGKRATVTGTIISLIEKAKEAVR
jgi:hypothetical protein